MGERGYVCSEVKHNGLAELGVITPWAEREDWADKGDSNNWHQLSL